jgi:hypothetical protein
MTLSTKRGGVATAKLLAVVSTRKLVISALAIVLLISGGVGFAPASASASANPAKDFVMSSKETSLVVLRGRQLSFDVQVTRGAQFTGKLKYRASSKLKKVKIKATKVSLTGATIQVTIAANAPYQQGPITVTASGGGRSHAVKVNLAIMQSLGSDGIPPPAPLPTTSASSTPTTTTPATTTPITTTPATTTPTTTLTTTPTTVPTTTQTPTTSSATTRPPVIGDFSVAVGEYFKVVDLVPGGEVKQVRFAVTHVSGNTSKPAFSIENAATAKVTKATLVRTYPGGIDIYELEIVAPASAPIGRATIAVKATDQNVVRTAPVNVHVNNFGVPILTATMRQPQVKLGVIGYFDINVSTLSGAVPDVELNRFDDFEGDGSDYPILFKDGKGTVKFLFIGGEPVGVRDVRIEVVDLNTFKTITYNGLSVLVSDKPRVSAEALSKTTSAGVEAEFTIKYEPVEGIATPTYFVESTVPEASVQIVPAISGKAIWVRVTTIKGSFLPVVRGTPQGSYPLRVKATSGTAVTEILLTLVVN